MEVSYSFYEVVLRLADFTGTKHWQDPTNYDPDTVVVDSQGDVKVRQTMRKLNILMNVRFCSTRPWQGSTKAHAPLRFCGTARFTSATLPTAGKARYADQSAPSGIRITHFSLGVKLSDDIKDRLIWSVDRR